MRIDVLGTGLEALATALVLRHNGFAEVRLVDVPSAPDDPVVELPPNGTRVLYATGLRDRLESAAAAPSMEHRRSAQTGYLLQQRPLGAFALDRYKAPHLVIDAPTLRAFLADALGKTGEILPAGSADADLIVIANGECPLDHDTTPRPRRTPTSWTRRWVRARPMGNTLTGWFAPGGYMRQMPALTGTYGVCIGGKTPHPRFTMLSESIESDADIAVEDAAPLADWYRDNQVMVGSAAHPLLPFTNQSFALLLEDAWVLARMLDGMGEDLPLALSEYQRYRLPRATRMQAFARAQGLLITEHRPLQRMLRNLRFVAGFWLLVEASLAAEDWLYEYNCLQGFD